MAPRHRPSDYETWLCCPHVCGHAPAHASRRDNALIPYRYGEEEILPGEIPVYPRRDRALGLHITSKTAHLKCKPACPGFKHLGKKHGVKHFLNCTLSMEQWDRWGLGIAMMYSGGSFANEIPVQYRDEFNRLRTTLLGSGADGSSSSGDGPGGTSSDVVSVHALLPDPLEWAHPLEGEGPSAPFRMDPRGRNSGVEILEQDGTVSTGNALSPVTPPTASAPRPELLFPLCGALGVPDSPLKLVWVEHVIQEKVFEDAMAMFVKVDMSPHLLKQYKGAFPRLVYYLDEDGTEFQGSEPRPEGSLNGLVQEHVSGAVLV